MKFLLSEQEMVDHKNEVSKLRNRVQELVGQLAEVKGVQGCPAIGPAKSEYPCCDCPMDNQCDFRGKSSYLPK